MKDDRETMLLRREERDVHTFAGECAPSVDGKSPAVPKKIAALPNVVEPFETATWSIKAFANWLWREPCELDVSCVKATEQIKPTPPRMGKPFVCEGGVWLEWHYPDILKPQKLVALAVIKAIKY